MSTYNHTPIPLDGGQEATAELFNSRFSDLDSAIGNVPALTTTPDTSIVAAIGTVAPTTMAQTVIGAINELDLIIGDLGTLGTTPKSSIVAAIGTATPTTTLKTLTGAINELDGDIVTLNTNIGTVSTLGTTPKTSIVAAIGTVAPTTAAQTMIGAINELDVDIGALSLINPTTPPASLAAAIGDLSTITTTVGTHTSVESLFGSATLRTRVTSRIIPALNGLQDDIDLVELEIDNATTGYDDLAAKLNSISAGFVGGNIATLTNGSASAGQKTVTVDSTVGFVVGSYVAYQLVGDVLEYNTIATVTPTTTLELGTNIGTGGIPTDRYISMISPSEYLAAQAVPHGATDLTLPTAMASAAGGVYNPLSFGAIGQASLQAAIDAAEAASPKGTVEIPSGVWEITTGITITEAIRLVGRGGTINFNPAKTNAAVVDCIMVSASNVVLDGIVMDGSSMDTDEQANVRRGIYIAGDVGTHIENVHVRNCKFTDLDGAGAWDGAHPGVLSTHAIFVIYADNTVIENNTIDTVSGSAVMLSFSQHCRVLNNRIHDTNWYSINCYQDVDYCEVAHNHISGTRTYCRYWGGSIEVHADSGYRSSWIDIHDNTITGSHSYGAAIIVASASHVTIANNFLNVYPGGTAGMYDIAVVTRAEGVAPELNYDACDHVAILNNICVADSAAQVAIYCQNITSSSAITSYFDGLIISGNQIKSIDATNRYISAILVGGGVGGFKNVIITNNVASGAPGTGPITGFIGLASSGGTREVENVVITGNVLTYAAGTLSHTTDEVGICIGPHTESVICRDNILVGFQYGLLALTNSATDKRYLLDQIFLSCVASPPYDFVTKMSVGHIKATDTWNPGEVVAGASATKTVTIPTATGGAAAGDVAMAGLSTLDEVGWLISANVKDATTAYVTITNTTGGNITVPDGGTVTVNIYRN